MYKIEDAKQCQFSECELNTEEWRMVDGFQFLWASSLGRLHWNFSRRGARFSKTTVGSAHDRGYYKIRIDKCAYFVHRIIVNTFIDHSFPIRCDKGGLEVDHIDTNPKNNRISNLRIVTRKENMNNPLTKKHVLESYPLRVRFGENHWHFGKKDSEEHRKKLSEAHKGFRVSENTKKKIRTANIGNNKAFKGIIRAENDEMCIDFDNWNDIASFLNADKSKVMNCVAAAMRKGHKSHSFRWTRIRKEEIDKE